jgi:Protein of unknown function (DUF2934)
LWSEDSRCATPKEYPFRIELWSAKMASRASKIDPKTEVTSDPNARPDITETVDETAIAARAHGLWRERGCPIGSPEVDWLRAEEELKKQPKVQTAA